MLFGTYLILYMLYDFNKKADEKSFKEKRQAQI